MSRVSLDRVGGRAYRERTLDAKPLKWKRAQSLESSPVSLKDEGSEWDRDTRLISSSTILGEPLCMRHCGRYYR